MIFFQTFFFHKCEETGAKFIWIVLRVYTQVLPRDDVIEEYGSTSSFWESSWSSTKFLIGYK